MERLLDPHRLASAMLDAGLTQTELAARVGVSKEAVSNWCAGESQPRPAALLRTILALNTTRDALLAGEATPAPRVCFRFKAHQKGDDEYRQRIRQAAKSLALLGPYLPEQFCSSGFIRNPSLEYARVQSEAVRFRQELQLASEDRDVGILKLIEYIERSGAVIIPVPWGDKRHPANGVHITVPGCQTNWLYLNIDTPVLDAKFWMLHEIAHMLTPSMDPESRESEAYAEAFAGAVLFPGPAAAGLYRELRGLASEGHRIERLKSLAKTLVVSPLTLYLETNNYASHSAVPSFSLEPAIYGAMKNVAKETPTISQIIFHGNVPTATDYVKECSRVFRTPVFDAMARLVHEKGKGSGLVARLLNVAAAEAMEIHGALASHGPEENPA